MTDFQQGIIRLMKSAITGEPAKLPEGFSIEEAAEFAAKQNITTLVYDGAVKCGISTQEPAMQRMFRRYMRLLLHSERQMMAIARVCKALDENGLDYLPLKGCNMKKCYPKPELRYMGDADILIRVEQYDRIRTVMSQLGLTEGIVNDYECHWSSADIHVEFHKKLIPSDRSVFYGYWGNGWDKAIKSDGSRHTFSYEDDFLFQLTHFAKHYSNTGIGCRYLLDLWVFLRSHPELDDAYLEQELKKLRLMEFYRNIRELIGVWFEDQETTDKADFMTEFIFSGGSWGEWKTGQIAGVARAEAKSPRKKTAYLRAKLFPPLSAMVLQYPLLKKVPILLPVFWLVRIIQALFRNSGQRKKAMYVMSSISKEMINTQKEHMRYVGLDFEVE